MKGDQPLSEVYIRQIHQKLTEDQLSVVAYDPNGRRMNVEVLRGEYKKLPNNPTSEVVWVV